MAQAARTVRTKPKNSILFSHTEDRCFGLPGLPSRCISKALIGISVRDWKSEQYSTSQPPLTRLPYTQGLKEQKCPAPTVLDAGKSDQAACLAQGVPRISSSRTVQTAATSPCILRPVLSMCSGNNTRQQRDIYRMGPSSHRTSTQITWGHLTLMTSHRLLTTCHLLGVRASIDELFGGHSHSVYNGNHCK